MLTLKRFFNKFVIFVIFLNTQMDLFILYTNVEKFTSTNKKTLHLIFKKIRKVTFSAKCNFLQFWRTWIIENFHFQMLLFRLWYNAVVHAMNDDRYYLQQKTRKCFQYQLHILLGLYRICFFQIRPEPDFNSKSGRSRSKSRIFHHSYKLA